MGVSFSSLGTTYLYYTVQWSVHAIFFVYLSTDDSRLNKQGALECTLGGAGAMLPPFKYVMVDKFGKLVCYVCWLSVCATCVSSVHSFLS